MKEFSVLVLAFLVATSFGTEESPERWPSLPGLLDIVNLVCPTYECPNPFVQFFLKDPKDPNSNRELFTGDANNLKESSFNSSYPTRFIIHGWFADSNTRVCRDLSDAFLAVDKYNVICVDWKGNSTQYNYCKSRDCVSNVGKKVAEMIDFLQKEGDMSFETLLVVGHSLGAHVAGFAGKNVKNGRIHQITGLDPAKPRFSYSEPHTRLHENDAVYVETIHTNGGVYGFLEPIGKAAFYPNGGVKQPGYLIDALDFCGTYCYSVPSRLLEKLCFVCNKPERLDNLLRNMINDLGPDFDEVSSELYDPYSKNIDKIFGLNTFLPIRNIISHMRSHKYYAEAIRKNNFITQKCNSYEDAVEEENCTSVSVRMGASDNYKNASGIYYVPVNKEKPFGTGNEMINFGA